MGHVLAAEGQGDFEGVELLGHAIRPHRLRDQELTQASRALSLDGEVLSDQLLGRRATGSRTETHATDPPCVVTEERRRAKGRSPRGIAA